MVAGSNLACFALFFLSTVLITHSMSEARLCRDPLCNEPISLSRVITNFEGTGKKGLLELKVGEKIYIYAKEPDETPELWYGESNGKGGFFPKEHVEELIVYEPKPAYVVSKDILENSEDPGGTDNKENNPNDKKTPENASESTIEEENKDKGENDKSKGTEGTMSGIISTISDFFSVPAGEEADESTLSNEQNTEIVKNNEEILRNISDNMQSSLQGEKGDKVEKNVGDNLESKSNDKIENGGNSLENVEEKKGENYEQTQLSGQNKEDASRHSSNTEQHQEEHVQGKDDAKGEGSTSKSVTELEEQQQKQAQQDESRKHAEIGNEDYLHHKVQAPEQNQEKQNVLQEDKEGEKSREPADVPVQNHEENKEHEKEGDSVKGGQSQDQQIGGLNPENKKQNKIEEDIEKRNHDLPPVNGNEIKKESKPEIQRGESAQEKDENKERQDKHQSIDNQKPGYPHQTDNTPNGQEEREGQKLTEQASMELDSQEHDKSEMEDNVEDALSTSVNENKEKRQETQGEKQKTANEEPNVMEQNSAEAVNSTGEKKLPQFIPGEYMSLPREELMKVLEERQKILNAQQKEEESKDNGDDRKVFQPAVLNPDGDDQSKSQDLSADGNQEGKKSMDEMVKSVQENLKAVVEEDLSRLGKANDDVKRERKKMESNNEFSPEDGQGIRDVSKEHSKEKEIEDDGEVENEKMIQSDSNGDIKVKTVVSSDEKAQEDPVGSASPERNQPPFSFKGAEILLQRRKLREKAEQEHHERTHGRNGEGNSDTEKLSSDGSVKQKSANEERHIEEKPESKKEVVDEKTNKGIENNDAKKVDVVADASNEGKPDDSSEQDETEDEEEEDYEEVAPLKVGRQGEALKQEPKNEPVKEKEDKVEPSSSQGDIAGKYENVQVEAVVKTKEENANSEERSKAEKEMKNKETLKLDDEEKKESLTIGEREEKEDVTNDAAQKNKEKEEEIKRQKEEEERQVRLHLLQEERKRVQALDEQAKILLQRKKEYEKKLEEDRLRKEKEKLKEEEERKVRIKLEVEKRLKAIEEEKKKKEEEERRRELEEERKKVEEETKRVENEMKRKEEENKRIEEEMKRMEEEQKKKSEDDNKKKAKEESYKLKEEMEIEAALKNKLKDLAKNEKVKPKEENLEGAGKMSSKGETKSVKEKLSSGKDRVQGESLIKNKFKKLKMKVQKNKNAGRNRKAKKIKAKKKRKFYDMNEIHLDQDSCMSISYKKRMSCGIDLTEDECHDEGCCFDDDAPPEIQCFYPPSEPVHYDEDDYEDDGKEDFLAEFDEVSEKKRTNKGKNRMNHVKKQPKSIPEESVAKKPTSENEPKAAAETVRKPDATKTEITLGSQDTTVVDTATSLANPTSTQMTTQTTQTTTQAAQTMMQATHVSDTTATSVINPTASTQVPAQATTSVAEDMKIVDAVQVPKPPVNNDTDVQQRPNTDTTPPAEGGARMILPNEDKPDIENLQPKVTYSEDKSFDRRVPPKEPPTLPTVVQTPLNEKEVPSNEVKTEHVPKETPPPGTPAKDLPDAINQPTVAPTSAAETVVPMVTDNENGTKKAEWKSYGILKGFWRFHELLAEKIIQFGQPLKGAVRGVLAFIGLGQVFDDICRDLASAPPFIIISTIVFGAFGVVFLFWSCIVSFSNSDAAKGPSPRDILKTYKARIRILEEELGGVEKSHKELQLQSAHAIEEKHHSDEAANTARKSLEQSMTKIKQNESEMHHLQEIINANKQEIQATSEEIEQKDEEIERMQQVADNYKGQVQSKEEEIQQLKEKIHEFEEIKGAMDEEIEVLKDRLDGFEEEKTSLDKEIKDWNNKYDDLQQSFDDQELRNRQIKEQYDFKCTEVEVLQGCLLQIKGKEDEEDEDEDELLSEEERDKIRSERLQAMLDASKSKAEVKIMKKEIMKYKTELEETKTAKEALEEKIQDLEHNFSEAKLNEEKAYLDFREKEIELAALRKYFKDTESELHRKLTAEESAREATESKLRTELSKANNDSRDLMTYKKLYADINEEIQRVKGNVGHQVAAVEERAHNNWLKYRTVERELEEVKRERDALRRRMYALEKEKNRPGSSASGKSSDSADGVRAESPIRGHPPPGQPAAPRIPDHKSPVPMAPPIHHPMYGPPPPVMPLGYGPPPSGRFGPPPPPQGYMGTQPPARNGPPPPPTGRTGSRPNTPTATERDERERRNSHGYGTDDPHDSRHSGHRSVSPPNGPRNHIESPSSFSRPPPVSSSTPGDPRHAKLGRIQNSLDNDRASLQNDYDSRPNDARPPYVPHPPGPMMSNSPMRPPLRPLYGPPMGPPSMGSPMRPPYGPARASPMGSPMGPPRPPPPGQSPVSLPPPMGPASGPNAYRRVSGNRPPVNSSTS